MKTGILISAILILTCWGFGEEKVVDLSNVKDGYALLDSLVSTFHGMPTDNFLAGVDGRLKQMLSEAKASRQANQIDPIFFGRFRRVLMIFRIIITPVEKNGFWDNLFEKELDDFVQDVIFEHCKMDKDGIRNLALAIEEEFVNLQLYLDDRQARENLKKKLDLKIFPPQTLLPGTKADKK